MSKQPDNDIQKKTIMNMFWRFAERFGAQGISFVISIVLARLLEPEAYGTIALVTVYINILQVFVESGFGVALVQNKHADDVDFSSVFYFNMAVCLLLYIVTYFSAPYIAQFYNNSQLTNLLRILSLTLIFSGVKNIQQAVVAKKMMFKKLFFATLSGNILAGFLGIIMAYCGLGVWALVAQQLISKCVDTIVLWFTVKWRPRLSFSGRKLLKNLSFGWKLLVANLLNTIYLDLRQLIIGYVYAPADLAYYNRGKQFPDIIATNINTTIDSVLLPVMSNDQDNTDRMKNMTRRAIKTSSYIIWPLMFGLMAIGEPLIVLLLTEKWLPCYPFLCIFCFVRGMNPIHTANLNAIKAMGRSDISLKLEIVKKTVGILVVVATMDISVLAISISSVFYTVFASIVNAMPNKKLLNYSYREQLQDMIPNLLMASIMGMLVYLIGKLNIPGIPLLVMQVFSGVVIYVGLSVVFKSEDYHYILRLIRSFLKND